MISGWTCFNSFSTKSLNLFPVKRQGARLTTSTGISKVPLYFFSLVENKKKHRNTRAILFYFFRYSSVSAHCLFFAFGRPSSPPIFTMTWVLHLKTASVLSHVQPDIKPAGRRLFCNVDASGVLNIAFTHVSKWWTACFPSSALINAPQQK